MKLLICEMSKEIVTQKRSISEHRPRSCMRQLKTQLRVRGGKKGMYQNNTALTKY